MSPSLKQMRELKVADDRFELPLLWERASDEIFNRSAKFPRDMRYTLGSRIDEGTLEIAVLIVDARYSSGAERKQTLREIDRQLNRLRVLVRLAYRRRVLNNAGYEQISIYLSEAGRMIGGWHRGRGEGRDGRIA